MLLETLRLGLSNLRLHKLRSRDEDARRAADPAGRALPGRQARVLLKAPNASGHRRPAGTAGAMIYRELPERPVQWRLLTTATRVDSTAHFPDQVPGGTRLWLKAWWISTNLQLGPASEPVSMRLPVDELVGQVGTLLPLQTTAGGTLQRAA
jgi:hypothetical protein